MAVCEKCGLKEAEEGKTVCADCAAEAPAEEGAEATQEEVGAPEAGDAEDAGVEE
ncbi:MAG: hypothetical protein M1355_03730 [Patescibacteria group bacterium]|nr:hypothetical protein [Patescibacteria group bacterium]